MSASIRVESKVEDPSDCGTAIDPNVVENGLLLRKDVHALFDRFFWSIDTEINPWRFVAFVANKGLALYHGKPVQKSAKRFANKLVLEWHFQQCVLRMLRGSAGPEMTYYQDFGPKETVTVRYKTGQEETDPNEDDDRRRMSETRTRSCSRMNTRRQGRSFADRSKTKTRHKRRAYQELEE
jgi:hypothetical protein